MPVYKYMAMDMAGKNRSGRIEADNENAALMRLQQLGVHITQVAEVKDAGKRLGGSGKVKLQSLVIFSRQFATMIDAGVRVVKCLDILEGQSKDLALKAVLGSVKRDVTSGLSLTEAMAKHPKCFTKLYVNMIKAAEAGGILDQVLDRLAMFLEKEQELRAKIKAAMMYPVVILVFSLIITAGLMIFVLPKFLDIFTQLGAPLPATTKALFAISKFLTGHWYLLFIVPAAIVAFLRWYGNQPSGRMMLDGLKLKIPVVGEMVQKMSVSRFARTFATLISAGVPMLRSLEIVGETAGNAVIARSIDTARNNVREGKKISEPLRASGLFPELVTQMIDVGEETGRLSEMLTKVADFYDSEVENAVKGLTSLIEPLMIVFMGVMVGFIAISVISPIFSLQANLAHGH
ncbi:MAG TPA: type II secretion system F family protein [Armatimonadota bacterium]